MKKETILARISSIPIEKYIFWGGVACLLLFFSTHAFAADDPKANPDDLKAILNAFDQTKKDFLDAFFNKAKPLIHLVEVVIAIYSYTTSRKISVFFGTIALVAFVHISTTALLGI